MSKPLDNRVALVTGASRGIGYAGALALARRGAHVIAVARTVGGLEELDDAVRAAGATATLVPLDMKDGAGIARLAEALNERFGRLDILVGNAGVINVSSPLAHIEPAVWDDVIAVNVTANWHLVRFMEPLLKRSDAGRVVFVTSGAAAIAPAYGALYALSKAALDVLARSYAAETASTAMRVNLFNPGRTRTRMHATAFPGIDPLTLDTPEQVAELLVELCLPSFTETGKVYDYPKRKLMTPQSQGQ
jgi:NAD(P)-dependent dehydrogenase (short-subunit alcohol dehydrogenase family)